MPARGDWRGKTRSVPASDLENRTLGTGDPTSSDRRAGKKNATWASIDLTTGAGAAPGTISEYDVPHDLGEVPTVVTLKRCENAAVAGTLLIANGVRPENWSHSHVHVSINLISGSFDGCRAEFLIEGK
jgi:hypothetical protein